MKLVSSLVRPEKVEGIKEGLRRTNVSAISIGEVRDHGPQLHETAVWRGHEYSLGCSQKMEVRVVVHDDDVDAVIGVIMKAARTGRTGDGHICVISIDHRYDIRSGQREVS